MIWVETPTNPMLNVIDIAAVAKGKPTDVCLVVDNTFATPYFQQPLALGADAVVHSATKYMAGHSDVIGGAIMTSRKDVYESCDFYRNAVGNVPGPFDCFLVHRGMKTLAVRMQQHDANARAVAGFLTEHANVERVFYPGLPDHPGHETAKKQMSGFSGMVSFELEGGRAERDRFLDKLEIFMLAESLGGVESLICYPAGMTHGTIPEAERNKIGITDRLLRLSVGIEHVDDLIADLDRAIG